MADFKKLSFEDYPIIKPYFESDNLRNIRNDNHIICDRVFDCTFLWRNYYDTRYAIVGDSAVLSISHGNTEMYSFPMGGDILHALKGIKEHIRNAEKNAYFCFIPQCDIHYFHEVFDCVFISEEPDWSDYLYNVTDIMNYAGKRYHGQRNFYNRFAKANPNAELVSVNNGNARRVIPFIQKWFAEHGDNSPMSVAEEKGIYELLDKWDSYSMRGAYLTASEEIVGFTAGEIIGNTAFIQIEKADHSMPGVYQYMSAEYLKLICHDGLHFVNREEDMGIPGLRKAKEDLHPVEKLKKFTLYCC